MELKVTYTEKNNGELIEKSFITQPRYNETIYDAESRIIMDLFLDEQVISYAIERLEDCLVGDEVF